LVFHLSTMYGAVCNDRDWSTENLHLTYKVPLHDVKIAP